MLDHRIGNVETLPSGPAGAESEVGVLAVKKEASIESADLLEHAATVERRRTAREEGFFEHRIVFGRASAAALLTAAVAGDKHARRVETRFAEQPHLRSAHTGIRPSFERGDQRIEPVRIRHGVVVEGREIWGARHVEALVDGPA